MSHRSPHPQMVCRLEGVAKHYDSAAAAVLSEIDLEVAQGELIALTGASGSGKTTLLNLLGLLDRPSTGHYWLDNMDVSELNSERRAQARRDKIGFIFQAFHLLPHLTVLDNVALPLIYRGRPWREARRQATAALAQVGLSIKTDALPAQLSGGQQQRVGVARALVCRPRLLLADEPTGNLDEPTALRVFELFARARRESQLAIVVVTHDARIAGLCDRICHIAEGRIRHDDARLADQTASGSAST